MYTYMVYWYQMRKRNLKKKRAEAKPETGGPKTKGEKTRGRGPQPPEGGADKKAKSNTQRFGAAACYPDRDTKRGQGEYRGSSPAGSSE